jgi:beta-glucanase (GH16 family)
MKKALYLLGSTLIWVGCNNQPNKELAIANETLSFSLKAVDLQSSSDTLTKTDSKLVLKAGSWASYTVEVPQTGRYRVAFTMAGADSASVWVEDYINNPDQRTYNITGMVHPKSNDSLSAAWVDGSPMQAGKHDLKIHAAKGDVTLKTVTFSILQGQEETPKVLSQNMSGGDWQLVWSDEFDGSGLPDTSLWNYNAGNWGWGNNEPQYYTAFREKNARQEKGNLIIEAHKNDSGQAWTSARLTTQGKQAFLNGKIEFRAKVPAGRGTWSAGWLLGDAYRDEISWPYCGEIDVLETVGYEINDTTGKGLNHASCHTRAYYFKQGNHLTATLPVDSMNSQWHTYGIEWYPDSIRAYVDNTFYYTYDKTANELEWPFAEAQNIIINLAVGGGWGGAKGIDESYQNHKLLVDYVRVYEKQKSPEK